jgi:hypothetical protein
VTRRGRPPKPRFKHPVGDADFPDTGTVEEIDRRVGLLAEASSLAGPQRAALVERLAHALAGYNAVCDLRGKVSSGRRGNTHQCQIPPLLLDCAHAWSAATSERPVLFEDRNDPTKASVAVRLAKILLGIAHGARGLHCGSLRRQIQITRDSWPEEF